MHSDSIVIPSWVSVVTTALIPVASPALIVIFNVDEKMSSLYVWGTHFWVWLIGVNPNFEHSQPFTVHIYDGINSPLFIISCLSSAEILSAAATCLSNSSNESPAPCASAKAIPYSSTL